MTSSLRPAVAQRPRRRRQPVAALDGGVQRPQPRAQRRQPPSAAARPSRALRGRPRAPPPPAARLRRLGRAVASGSAASATCGAPAPRPRPRPRPARPGRSVGEPASSRQPRAQVGQPGDPGLHLAPQVGRLALGLGVRPAGVERRRPAPASAAAAASPSAALVGRLERRHLGHVLLRRPPLPPPPRPPAVRPRGRWPRRPPGAAPRRAPARPPAVGPRALRGAAGRGTSRTRRSARAARSCAPASPASSRSAVGPPLADLRHLGVDRVAGRGLRRPAACAARPSAHARPAARTRAARSARRRSRRPAWPPDRRPSPASPAAAAARAPRARGRGRARARPPPAPASTRPGCGGAGTCPGPAASSTNRRRSCGLASRISSTRPWPITECISRPRPVSDSSSSTSSRRTRARLMKYSLSPSRVRPAHDRDLAELDRQRRALVVQHQLDLADAGRRPRVGAAEQHVQTGRARAAGPATAPPSPTAGRRRCSTCRCRWARRPPRCRARSELDAVGERLEPAHPQRLQVHRLRSPLSPGGLPPAIPRSASLAAACSDAFLLGPDPRPSTRPSTSAAVV